MELKRPETTSEYRERLLQQWYLRDLTQDDFDIRQMPVEIDRPLDEAFDTQIEVEQNPCGAHLAIQALQGEVDRLRRETVPADYSKWSHYVVPMPINEQGQGPVSEQEAHSMTYEVWDHELLSHSSHKLLSNAIGSALGMVRYTQELKDQPQETFWNGEPCRATRVKVRVGKAPVGWWCEELRGQVIQAVRVEYGSQRFYIDNRDGHGWRKVTEGRGGPNWPHASLPSSTTEEEL